MPASKRTSADTIETQVILPSSSLLTIPGALQSCRRSRSILSRIEPPVTPPLKFSMSSLGIFTSNKPMTTSLSFEVKSRSGIDHKFLNLFVLSHSGIARHPKHLVLRNDDALQDMISTAAKSCSGVCGCGHTSLPATSSKAASMKATPIVQGSHHKHRKDGCDLLQLF